VDEQNLPRPEFIKDLNKKDSGNRRIGLFRCKINNCNKEFESPILYVNSEKWNRVKSCGCYQKKRVAETGHKNATHGKSTTSEYYVYKTMLARCYNPNNSEYHRYGAIGITICDRWLEKKTGFPNFYSDMGPKPDKKLSIERVNNLGNYEPGNCIWATSKQQGRNKKNNRLITYKGYTKTLAEWAEITGFDRKKITHRLDDFGWTVEDALTKVAYNSEERIIINLPEVENEI
jgi:hypothetical protein